MSYEQSGQRLKLGQYLPYTVQDGTHVQTRLEQAFLLNVLTAVAHSPGSPVDQVK